MKRPTVFVNPPTVHQPSCQREAASPAVHVSVLVVDGQTGEPPLQLTKPRPVRQVGAQQQTTQDVSDGGKEVGQ